MSKVFFIAVHPDDETLGCGGTILKHKDNGDEIYWLILTKANQKITNIENIEAIQKKYVREVAEKYEFNKYIHLDYLTTELSFYDLGSIIRKVKNIFDEFKPEIVYLPNRSDVHSDHKVAFEACYSATKNFRAPYIKKILMYETLSETEFAPAIDSYTYIPNVFFDITAYFELKIKALEIYKVELMNKPFPRSLSTIEALARYRGSRIGVQYAEAFQLLLDIK